MAVVDVKETWHNRRGRKDDKLQRAYGRSWRVITNSPLDGPEVVLAALGIAIHDGHPADAGALCRVLNVEHKDNEPRLWMVEADYDARGEDPTKQEENPLLRPAVKSWTNAQTMRPFVEDIDGNAVLNSAQEPFDPSDDVEEPTPKLHIQRFEAAFDEGLALQYLPSVNNDYFYGMPPNTWKCTRFDGRDHFENGIRCVSVDYEFEYNWRTWTRKIQDKGFHELIDGKLEKINDKFGDPISSPTLLNGSGYKLSRATTTLVVALEASITDEQIEIADDANFGFPAAINGNQICVKVGDEKIYLTSLAAGAISGVLYNCVRAARGTSVAFHNVGAEVTQEPVYLHYKAYRPMSFTALALV